MSDNQDYPRQRSDRDKALARKMKRSRIKSEYEQKEQYRVQKSNLFEAIESYVDRATFGRIFPTLSAHYLREVQEKQLKLSELNLYNYFTLRYVDLAFLPEELILKVIEHTGIDDKSVIAQLDGDFVYYLAHHDLKEHVNSFSGRPKLRILRALAFDLFKRKGIENAHELAEGIAIKDQSALMLAFSAE